MINRSVRDLEVCNRLCRANSDGLWRQQRGRGRRTVSRAVSTQVPTGYSNLYADHADGEWVDFDLDGPSTSAPSWPMAAPSWIAPPKLQTAPLRLARPAALPSRPAALPSRPPEESRLAQEREPAQEAAGSQPAPERVKPIQAPEAEKKAEKRPIARNQLQPTVKAASSPEELLELMQQFPITSLTPAEIILLCNQLARVTFAASATVRVWNQTQAVVSQALSILDGAVLEKLANYDLVVLVAAVARLRYTPSEGWMRRFFLVCTPRLDACGSGNLATILRAVTKMNMDPWELKNLVEFDGWMLALEASILKRMKAFRGDEMVRIISAMAALRHKPPTEWMAAFSTSLLAKLPSMDPRLLATSMLAFANLKYQPSGPLVKAYYMQVYSKLPMFDDHDLASVAQALAVLRRILKHEFLGEFLEEVVLKLPTFGPQALSHLLVALAVSAPNGRVHLSEEWLRKVAGRAFDVMLVSSGDCVANTVWALSLLGLRPDASFLERMIAVSTAKMFNIRNTQLIRIVTAVSRFGYVAAPGPAMQALSTWCGEFCKLASRRSYDMADICDFVSGLAGLPPSSVYEPLRKPAFVRLLLQQTRFGFSCHNSNPKRLASLARSLHLLRHRPNFGFLHNFTQACRFMWTSFKPQEYADLIAAMAFMACPVTMDPLWTSEFLAIIQCRMAEFPPRAMATLLSSVGDLPGSKPSAPWLALAVASVVNSINHYTGKEMCAVVIALSRFGYRPPPDVFDMFVQHLSEHTHQLAAEDTVRVADALAAQMPGYLGGRDGHQQYHELQMRLRAVEVPARVLLRAIPGAEGGGVGSVEDTPPAASAEPDLVVPSRWSRPRGAAGGVEGANAELGQRHQQHRGGPHYEAGNVRGAGSVLLEGAWNNLEIEGVDVAARERGRGGLLSMSGRRQT